MTPRAFYKTKCNMDCFNCIYPDCINNSPHITAKEKEMREASETELRGKRPKEDTWNFV